MPRSLLSYFTASKSRAAACERLLLEKPEGVNGNTMSNKMCTITRLSLEIMDYLNAQSDSAVMSYGDDLTSWRFKCDPDVMKLEERLHVACRYPCALRVKVDVVFLSDVGHV